MKNVSQSKKSVKSVLVISLLSILALSSATTGVLPHVFATITNAQFSPSDNVVGTYTFYTVKFVLGTTATISNIVLTWPAGYNVATEKFVFNNGVPFGTTTATNGPPVTITYCFGSTACTTGGGTPTSESLGDVVTFMFANIQNPTTAGSYTPTSICTYDLTTRVECQTTIPSITIGDITSSDLASSISIAALTTGTLNDTGTLSVTGAATFGGTVTTTGLLTANDGIVTDSITSGYMTITAPDGIDLLGDSGGVNVVGNITSTGTLDDAAGLFQVNTFGQITTPSCGATCLESNSVNFNSFAGGALPFTEADTTSDDTTTGTIAPGRNAIAIVSITVTLSDSSLSDNWAFVTLGTSIGGVHISPGYTVDDIYVPAGYDITQTFEFMVTGLTSSSSGTFTSIIYSGSPPINIQENYISVILLPN